MVGYYITSILSKSFGRDGFQRCQLQYEDTFGSPLSPSIVNVSQVFFSSSIRTFDVALTRPTVRYHLFESYRDFIKNLKLYNLDFCASLMSKLGKRLNVDDEQQEDDIVDM